MLLSYIFILLQFNLIINNLASSAVVCKQKKDSYDLSIKDKDIADLFTEIDESKEDLNILIKKTLTKLPLKKQYLFLKKITDFVAKNNQSIIIELDLDSCKKDTKAKVFNKGRSETFFVDSQKLVSEHVTKESDFLKEMLEAGFVADESHLRLAILNENSLAINLLLDYLEEDEINKVCEITGDTALILALKNNVSIDIIKNLIDHQKINLKIKDNLGNSPIDYAKEAQIYKILASKIAKEEKNRLCWCCGISYFFKGNYQRMQD
jgi:hypothetical protein